MERNLSIKTRAAAGALLCTLGCMAALAGGAPAFADTTAGNTDLYVQANASQLSVTVPSRIDFAASGDGTLTGPTTAKIINNSVMGVHVSQIAVTPIGATLTALADVGTAADTIGVQMTPNSHTAVEIADFLTAAAPAQAADWSMGKADAGGDGDEILLAFAGKIGSFGNISPASQTQFGQLVWTVAPGA